MKKSNNILHSRFADPITLNKLHSDLFSTSDIQYIVVDNFFDESFLEGLYDEIQKNFSIQTGDSEGRTIELVMGKYAKKFYRFYNSSYFQSVLSQIIGEKIRIENHIGKTNTTLLWGGVLKKLGCFVRRSKVGSILGWHTDGPDSLLSGSLIIYLNKEWEESYGGVLELGKLQGINVVPITKILPLFNRVVILKTKKDTSWHRVTMVKEKERLFFHDQMLKVNVKK